MVGCGTLFPSAQRGSACFAVEVGEALILLDCGPGSLHGLARAGVSWMRLTHILLTHLHLDHVSDLSPLVFALRHAGERTDPLVIVGPPGIASHYDGLCSLHGSWLREPGFLVEVRELGGTVPGQEPDSEFSLRHFPTLHNEESVAYRVEGEGSLGYTGDTGPTPGLGSFLGGVAVLIAECSQPDPPSMDRHLSPRSLADLAREAQPGLIITTHAFPHLDAASVPEMVSQAGYEGAVIAGKDGDIFEVPEFRRIDA